MDLETKVLETLKLWNIEPQKLSLAQFYNGTFNIGVVLDGEYISLYESSGSVYSLSSRVIREHAKRTLLKTLNLGENLKKISVDIGPYKKKDRIYHVRAQIGKYYYYTEAENLQQAKDMLLEQYKSGKGSKAWI